MMPSPAPLHLPKRKKHGPRWSPFNPVHPRSYSVYNTTTANAVKNHGGGGAPLGTHEELGPLKIRQVVKHLDEAVPNRKDVPLYLPIKAGYGDKTARAQLEGLGYKYDEGLSNDNEQFYYNPEKKKLITNISGTHNLADGLTDLALGVGRLQHTSRFAEADKKYNEAKIKYADAREKVLTGHSLGGGIVNYLAGSGEKGYTLDGAYAPFTKNRENITDLATRGDVVSTFGHFDKGGVLANPNLIKFDPVSAHAVDNIKQEMIYV